MFLKLMCSHFDERGYGIVLKNQGREMPETAEEIFAFYDAVHKDMKSMGINAALCMTYDDVWVEQCLRSAEKNGLKLVVEGFRDLVINGCGTPEAVARKIRMTPPHLRIPRCTSPPDLDDGWQGAAKTTLSVKTAIPPFLDEVVLEGTDEKTDVSLLYDASNLYLKFVCHEPEMNKLKASGWKYWVRHSNFNDDVVRFVINPAGGDKARHMCINCLGGNARTWWILERHNRRLKKEYFEREWEESWEEHVETAVRMNRVSWELFVKVPLDYLGLAPEPGVKHRMNLVREEQGKQETSLWSAPFAGMSLERFGTCEFIEAEAVYGDAPLSGRVCDEQHLGLPGAAATGGGTTVVTDDNGVFVLPCNDQAVTEITAYRPGYEETVAPKYCGEVVLRRDRSYRAEIRKVTESVRKRVKAVRDSKAVIAYYPFDEPQACYARALGKLTEIIALCDPGRDIVSSIAPPNLDQMRYLTKAMHFSRHIITHYHFYRDTAPGDFDEPANRGLGYTDYLDAAHAEAPELDLWPAMQAFKNHIKVTKAVDHLAPPAVMKVARWRMPSPEELKGLIFLGLAHGIKGVFYFTYNYFDYPGETVWGLIDENGNRNEPLIEVIREMNAFIEEHSELLLDLRLVDNVAEIEGGSADVQTHINANGVRYLFAVNKDINESAKLKIRARQRAERVEEAFSGAALEMRGADGFIEFEDELGKVQGKLYKLVES